MSTPPKFDSAKQSKPHTVHRGAGKTHTGSKTANSSSAYSTYKGGKK